MTFSSLVFLFLFLPLFFVGYYLTPVRYRNYTAVLGSLAFYAWGAPRFVFVLLGASLFDYLIAKLIYRHSSRPKLKKRLLFSSIVFNLALLFYFKYANFFIDQVQQVLAAFDMAPLPWVGVVLPIGISFFTFHKLSYTVDVYQGTVEPARDFATFALYITLFPQLIAGPIIRYHDIANQLIEREHSIDQVFAGFFRFCVGLAKKILIADQLAGIADKLFAAELSGLPVHYAWLGILSYAFQIHFDFSGYSDMAIGLGQMMGFRFPENFNQPYTARNITDFWRRWHITLSAWMREYLYIPLGGNRHGTVRTYLNLWIVFLLSGLWHGASWTFVFWGAFHGFFLVIDKLFWLKFSARLPKIVNVSLTFLLVLIGWIFFRSETFSQALTYLTHLFGLGAIVPPKTGLLSQPSLLGITTHRALYTFALAAAICFSPLLGTTKLKQLILAQTDKATVTVLQFVAILLLLSLSILSIANAKFIPFIYFRF